MTGPSSRKRLAAMALILLVAGVGCHRLRFPDAPPPDLAPPEQTSQPLSWSQLSRQGRGALRAGDFEASQKAYLASLAATSHFGADDIRVTTSLDNLARLATLMQRDKEFDQAAALVAVLAENAEAGRLAEFESGAPPLFEEAGRLAEKDQFTEAIRLYRLSLTLLGADELDNRSLRHAAQWNLADAYIETGQISKAEEILDPLSESLNATFDENSPLVLGLSIQTGRILLANGDTSGAEVAYLKVIDSPNSPTEQKIEALELYVELLRGLDRLTEAEEMANRLQALRQDEQPQEP